LLVARQLFEIIVVVLARGDRSAKVRPGAVSVPVRFVLVIQIALDDDDLYLAN